MLTTDSDFAGLGVVAILWLLWCAQHSLLISHRLTSFIQEKLPAAMVWYRLVYNLFAFVTLIPIVLYTGWEGGPPVLTWQGWTVALRLILLVLAVVLFYGGAARYDLDTFLGLRQLREKRWQVTLAPGEEFSGSGVFGVTRHPWYLGSLFFIWSVFSQYTAAMFCAAVVLSGYLVVGTWLEERKILQSFPDTYGAYQQKVSMLFPWKWLWGVFGGRGCR